MYEDGLYEDNISPTSPNEHRMRQQRAGDRMYPVIEEANSDDEEQIKISPI